MQNIIDTSFDFYSDTPVGKDPDSFSPTLRSYHQALWSKPLPNGAPFKLLPPSRTSYLHYRTDGGEFHLSSDAIGHTYRDVKAMAHIIKTLPAEEVVSFYKICSTIGAYIVFPSRRIGGKPTINGARGMHWKIKDRFDLTLECIRRHYASDESPLTDTLLRYRDFFDIFENFDSYVDFFLLQDAVVEDRTSIRFFLPFKGFEAPPLPADIREYELYRGNVVALINDRNKRINGQSFCHVD